MGSGGGRAKGRLNTNKTKRGTRKGSEKWEKTPNSSISRTLNKERISGKWWSTVLNPRTRLRRIRPQKVEYPLPYIATIHPNQFQADSDLASNSEPLRNRLNQQPPPVPSFIPSLTRPLVQPLISSALLSSCPKPEPCRVLQTLKQIHICPPA